MRRANVRELTRHTEYPSVSILMPTHRAHPVNQQDVIRLKNLLEEARRRLEDEVGKRPSWPVLDRLTALADEVDWVTNEEGLALFASDSFGAWYRLPFTVGEQVVVDRTFATRELLYALHRMPRYRALSLSEGGTRLFEGAGEQLEEVRNGGFPMRWRGPSGVTRRPDAPQMRGSNVREAHLEEFLGEVREALARATEGDTLPLVLVAPARLGSDFEQQAGGIAVRVEGSYPDATPAAIARVAWPPFAEWLAGRRHEVLAQVAQARGANRLAWGLIDAWGAARAGQGQTLVVEEGYLQPAVVRREGWELELVEEDSAEDGPEHVDDAVDELIEIVLQHGGEAVFVDPGSLEEAHVALILRYS